ncbi:MAG: nicotinate-nucleotide--dimethylbenzimidazole phosphoribosyltransferase [Myxococcota bacterium]
MTEQPTDLEACTNRARATDIPKFDSEVAELARARLDQLTKPKGALGALEDLITHLAGAQGLVQPQSRPAASLVFAADHPVVRHHVSAYPSEVTRAMVNNMRSGGAAASVLSGTQGVALRVVDVGVDAPVDLGSGDALSPLLREGAGDLRSEDAMTLSTFEAAFSMGQQSVRELDPKPRVLILGEMGIGNTTVASAVASALLECEPSRVVGAGTGLDTKGLRRKVKVVEDAVARLESRQSPLEVLRRLGGRELAAIAGATLEAVHRRMVVLLDGFIVSTAVLALARAKPEVVPFLVPGHCSREPGHRLVLEALLGPKVRPLLELDLALGEGSGALLALPLLDLAVAIQSQMATFSQAQVPDRSGP